MKCKLHAKVTLFRLGSALKIILMPDHLVHGPLREHNVCYRCHLLRWCLFSSRPMVTIIGFLRWYKMALCLPFCLMKEREFLNWTHPPSNPIIVCPHTCAGRNLGTCIDIDTAWLMLDGSGMHEGWGWGWRQHGTRMRKKECGRSHFCLIWYLAGLMWCIVATRHTWVFYNAIHCWSFS